MPEMDYSRLRVRVMERGKNQKIVAKCIGISEGQMSQKLAGNFAFKQSEIIAICRVLQLDLSEIPKYFFCPKS